MATTRSRCGLFSGAAPPRPPRPPSRRSPPAAGPPWALPPRRCCPGIRRSSSRSWSSSELQTVLAGGVGKGGDAAGVLVATAVEHDLLDALVLGAGRDERTHLAGLLGLVACVGDA